MKQMESPKRKMQKKNDYQRHKLFRKIKRRRKAQAEADQQVAMKQLRKKLKLPKFGNGKTREVYTSDIHFNNDDTAGGIDRYGNKFDYIELPETVVAARKIPTFKDIKQQTKNQTHLKKPSGKKGYKDTGDRIYGLKLSRKTKQ